MDDARTEFTNAAPVIFNFQELQVLFFHKGSREPSDFFFFLFFFSFLPQGGRRQQPEGSNEGYALGPVPPGAAAAARPQPIPAPVSGVGAVARARAREEARGMDIAGCSFRKGEPQVRDLFPKCTLGQGVLCGQTPSEEQSSAAKLQLGSDLCYQSVLE